MSCALLQHALSPLGHTANHDDGACVFAIVLVPVYLFCASVCNFFKKRESEKFQYSTNLYFLEHPLERCEFVWPPSTVFALGAFQFWENSQRFSVFPS